MGVHSRVERGMTEIFVGEKLARGDKVGWSYLDVAGPTSPWVGGTAPKVRLVGRRPMAAASVLVGARCLDLGGRSRGIAQTKESPDLVGAVS
jgi:hypothetical protein